MSKGALGITRVVETLDLILTSPLVRAYETATIVANAFHAPSIVQVCKELSPGSSMKQLAAVVGKFKQFNRIMLVGHEPDLSYFGSSILGTRSSVLEFKKGSLCCIEATSIPPPREGLLQWHLTPKQLRELARKER